MVAVEQIPSKAFIMDDPTNNTPKVARGRSFHDNGSSPGTGGSKRTGRKWLRSRSKSTQRSQQQQQQQQMQSVGGSEMDGTQYTEDLPDEPPIPRRYSSGLRSRLRSRSASITRGSKNSHQRKASLDDYDGAPPDYNEQSSTDQIAEIIERYQLALRMDMTALMDNHEKEIKFWKNKAMKLKKRMTTQDPSFRSVEDVGGGGGWSPLSQTNSDEYSSTNKEQVSALQREVEQRDTLIESLRKTMEMQEKGSEDRVQLLEDQLERLVEMRTTAFDKNSNQILPPTPSGAKDKSKRDPVHEVAVLEQLLARILAEKDKLLFENQNLKSVMQGTQYQQQQQSNIKGYNPKEQKEQQAVVDKSHILSKHTNHTTIDDNTNLSDPKTVEDGEHATDDNSAYTLRYQMSCRNCHSNHSHIKYMGKCNTSPYPNTQTALKETLEHHFTQIWDIVQEHDDSISISSDVHADELSREEANISMFPNSSLARHLAKHCQVFGGRGKCAQWCKENIKVEVQGGGVSAVPPPAAASGAGANNGKKKQKGRRKTESLTRTNSTAEI